jgi:hypothetical protein
MRDWSYGINSLPQWNYGSLHLVDQPWWLWLADKVGEQLSSVCCSEHTPLKLIPLPKWSIFDECEDAALFFHYHVWEPLFTRVWKVQQKYTSTIELGYSKLKEVLEPLPFGGYAEIFKSHESLD